MITMAICATKDEDGEECRRPYADQGALRIDHVGERKAVKRLRILQLALWSGSHQAHEAAAAGLGGTPLLNSSVRTTTLITLVSVMHDHTPHHTRPTPTTFVHGAQGHHRCGLEVVVYRKSLKQIINLWLRNAFFGFSFSLVAARCCCMTAFWFEKEEPDDEPLEKQISKILSHHHQSAHEAAVHLSKLLCDDPSATIARLNAEIRDEMPTVVDVALLGKRFRWVRGSIECFCSLDVGFIETMEASLETLDGALDKGPLARPRPRQWHRR